MLPSEHVVETQRQPEPITYNVSTYLGMILARSRESPQNIKDYLLGDVAPRIPNFDTFDAFYIMVPPRFAPLLEMFTTKFDELFGGRINGRCYTTEQTLHAKTVVPWDRELFIAIGCDNARFGLHRFSVLPPPTSSFAMIMAVGYYIIGHIQAQRPPWFKQHAAEYEEIQKKLFRSFTGDVG